METDVLKLFHPAVARWFRESFQAPTPPQQQGWPRIAAGEHTLILSPTGSGKTLAAFLYAIDEAIHSAGDVGSMKRGVHTLYLSPLKALANDIERNLDPPLEGVQQCAQKLGMTLPEIRVGVRTGDTPQTVRRQMVRRPPSLLITTPESLHLLLTSIRAREMLRTVRYVIVDEIHSMCSSKRGTFLSLLLERLDALNEHAPLRIGLSATQRPLEEVARFLGGTDAHGTARPVAIVDAGMRKSMDLEVVSPVPDMTALPQDDHRAPSAWPAIYERLLEMVEGHESTLIFANSRRVVERISAEMNRRAGHDFVRAHHGSVSREQRHRIEQALKDGLLPALVATSSMELGIDVGAIDLVCQVELPYSVASGLQRVGRAGHLVRATSKGRLIPKTRADLLMMACMARSMLRGEISAVRIPKNPLDVLAQQMIAMISVDEWDAEALYARVRSAYPYQDLPLESFEAVLDQIAGTYRTPELPSLRPRVSWDRMTGKLYPMPGSRQLAVLNGGTIPDTGQYPMVLEDGRTRIGELDEEFVFERRVGETFVLGTGQWRVLEIRHDRVVVSSVEEPEAMMPFWKGDGLGHDAEFGWRFGRFIRACMERAERGTLKQWLREESMLDEAAAENTVSFVAAQLKHGGALPTDRCLLVDVFPNEAGDMRVAVLTPFGRSFHLALHLAIQGALRAKGQALPEAVFSNGGILFRPGSGGANRLIEALRGFRVQDLKQLILSELENTPYFAMRFRRNAARALLLPRARPGKRTPLWLQRLRSHELLAYASQHPNFPVVLETYREILEDKLPLQTMMDVVAGIETGEISVTIRRGRGPSPFAGVLLLDFAGRYLYEDDRPVRQGNTMASARSGLRALLGEDGPVSIDLLDREAVAGIEARLQALSPRQQARNGVEAIELLRRIGDLSRDELEARCGISAQDVLGDLILDGRIVPVNFPGAEPEHRWICSEDAVRYERLDPEDIRWIVNRYVMHHAYRTLQDIVQRYPMALPMTDTLCQTLGWSGIRLEDGSEVWTSSEVLAGLRRETLRGRRNRIRPVAPEIYAQSLLRLHTLHAPLGVEGLQDAMEQLGGCRFPISVWDDILRQRIRGYRRELLDDLVRSGWIEWTGWCEGQRSREVQLAPAAWRSPHLQKPWEVLSKKAREIADVLMTHGALFLHQLAGMAEGSPAEISEALWELMWAGWVTNDSIRAATEEKPTQLRTMRRQHRHGWGAGRWSAVVNPSVEGEDTARASIRVLFGRYGMLTRDIAGADVLPISWREAYGLLTRMEWGGEVERAYFVSGLSAPQFAQRSMIDRLHSTTSDLEPKLLHVSDPACAFGTLFPVLRGDGSRYIIRHHPGNYLVVCAGRPVLAVENRAQRLVSLAALTEETLGGVLKTLDGLIADRTQPAAIRIETLDGAPILGSRAASALSSLGFSREDQGMVRYREF